MTTHSAAAYTAGMTTTEQAPQSRAPATDVRATEKPRYDYTAHQFAPGRSTNPGGRPRKIRVLEDLARENTIGAFNTMLNVMYDEQAPPHVRLDAADKVLDRGWGKARQAVTVGGDPDNPVRVLHEQIATFGDGELVAIIASLRATLAALPAPGTHDGAIEGEVSE